MNDKPRGEARQEDAVAELMQLAGRRRRIPDGVLAELKQIAEVTWQEQVRSRQARRRQRFQRSLALAAGVALAVGFGGWRALRTPAPAVAAVVAQVSATSGAVNRSTGDLLEIGADVRAGVVIQTGAEGHAALRLAGGTDVRLDRGTRLELLSTATLALSRGAIYLDSGLGGSDPVEVRTPYGIARDVGTQFEVRLVQDGLRVQVREGEVQLDRDGELRSASAGTVLSVAADGSVEITEIPEHGPAWDWVVGAGSVFELEGATLGEFLDWLARETGWRVRWLDEELEREVRGETTYGSLEGLEPAESLELVLPSAGLSYELDGGELTIRSGD